MQVDAIKSDAVNPRTLPLEQKNFIEAYNLLCNDGTRPTNKGIADAWNKILSRNTVKLSYFKFTNHTTFANILASTAKDKLTNAKNHFSVFVSSFFLLIIA